MEMSCHGLRGSASPVLTATGFVNGRWQFSTPHRIHTPWPFTKKIVASDYVGDPYGCAKFGANPSTGGCWANGWNITKFIYLFIYLYLFSSTHLLTGHVNMQAIASGSDWTNGWNITHVVFDLLRPKILHTPWAKTIHNLFFTQLDP